MKKRRAVIAVSNVEHFASTQKKTGVHALEVAHLLFHLEKNGVVVDFVSLRGGRAPLDPSTLDRSDAILRDYLERPSFSYRLENTLPLRDIDLENYGALIFAGGFGALWDFPGNFYLAAKVLADAGGTVAALSQGVVGLLKTPGQFEETVAGKEITGMTTDEIVGLGIEDLLPFLPEEALGQAGARFLKKPRWQKHWIVNQGLITGQNPQSALPVSEAVAQTL